MSRSPGQRSHAVGVGNLSTIDVSFSQNEQKKTNKPKTVSVYLLQSLYE